MDALGRRHSRTASMEAVLAAGPQPYAATVAYGVLPPVMLSLAVGRRGSGNGACSSGISLQPGLRAAVHSLCVPTARSGC